ncbi:uncharacterized protein TNCV_2126571 [Trichonephila clavipes]|nr:uncharacterized protein TNCV_2126571 [Trichonephila clavipes]
MVRSSKGSIGFELLMGKLCRGGTGGGQFHIRLAHTRKYGGPPKSSPKLNCLGGGEMFSDSIGLTWEHDILVLKPSPCLQNWSQVYDWMILDEWDSWFKSQVRGSNRSQDIVDLNTF